MEKNGAAVPSLYHISRLSNKTSIQKLGLFNGFARPDNKRKAIYAVTEDAVSWALAHASIRHNVRVSELGVWTINPNQYGWRRHNGGLWWSAAVRVDCQFYMTAELWVTAEEPTRRGWNNGQ